MPTKIRALHGLNVSERAGLCHAESLLELDLVRMNL